MLCKLLLIVLATEHTIAPVKSLESFSPKMPKPVNTCVKFINHDSHGCITIEVKRSQPRQPRMKRRIENEKRMAMRGQDLILPACSNLEPLMKVQFPILSPKERLHVIRLPKLLYRVYCP